MQAVAMLVYKDLVQQRSRLLVGCAILVIFSLNLAMGGEGGIGSIGGVLGGLIMVTTLGTAYEEDQGGLIYLRSLPLSARDITAGKFLSTLSFAFLFTASGLLPVLLLTNSSQTWQALVPGVVAAASSGLLLSGFLLAVFFRHGYRSIRLYLMYFSLVPIGLALGWQVLQNSGLVRDAGQSTQQQGWLHTLAAWSAVSTWRPVMLTLMITATLYLLLLQLATRNLQHRDL
ncbi:MAG: ABC-2 transporter permease [Limnochordia bacterium]|jgi:hypothetical protein